MQYSIEHIDNADISEKQYDPKTSLENLQAAVAFCIKVDFQRPGLFERFYKHAQHLIQSNEADDQSDTLLSIQNMLVGFLDKKDQQKIACIASIAKEIADYQRLLVKDFFKDNEHEALNEKHLDFALEKLSTPVQFLKGVGPALAKKLKLLDIETTYDVLMHVPFRFEDRRKVLNCSELSDGMDATIRGEVVYANVSFYKYLKKNVYEVVLQDDFGEIKLKWFQFSKKYLDSILKVGKKVLAFGKIKQYKKEFQIIHPDIEADDNSHEGQIVAVYPSSYGLTQKLIRKIVSQCMQNYLKYMSCFLPKFFCETNKLMAPQKVLHYLHFPKQILSDAKLNQMRKTLLYNEMYMYGLSLIDSKRQNTQSAGIAFKKKCLKAQQLLQNLPFKLTQDQKDVLTDIQNDLVGPYSMNRLLQGDVGSGKTIVAFLAALHVIDNGYQVALVAPTEVLAKQHFEKFNGYAKQLNVTCSLLLGKQKTKEKNSIYAGIEFGELNLIIGTHAVFQDKVHFKHLGLLIIDEQHRFGVKQRAKLLESHESKDGDDVQVKAKADVLLLSATPIPRTLALTAYGDLNISTIAKKPKGRIQIVCNMFSESKRMLAYSKISEHVQRGQQAFVVYPLIEESEKIDLKNATQMYELFKSSIFPQFKVGLLHGKLSSEQKDAIMQAFYNKEYDILVSTTVIEVGIDIPNASIIVVEHPERFGLAQLHQLRGRVGRSDIASECCLIYPDNLSQSAKYRLKFFVDTHDGFALAEKDLESRGPGDFLGTQQTGFPKFKQAKLPDDLKYFEHIQDFILNKAAKNADFDLEKEINRSQKIVKALWKNQLDFYRVG